MTNTARVHGYCPLCVSRCGSIATVEDGVFTSLQGDADHPTGQAFCIKGKVAPELVYSPQRLTAPLKRTNPKGENDPGWEEISWEEALDTTARRLADLSRQHGPETVAFATASPSTAATSDVVHWIQRLQRAYGSPNFMISMELCGWGRHLASLYTFGASVPGTYMPDIDRAGCLLYWGYNPSVARICHAAATNLALKRGARLVVIDPRNVGVARQAHEWLRVRPGTDGALALAMAGIAIDNGWYDEEFVRDWSNGPFLVRNDNGRFLAAGDIDAGIDERGFVVWDEQSASVDIYRPETGKYDREKTRPSLTGSCEIATENGVVACKTAFQNLRELCAEYTTPAIEDLCGVPLDQIERTVRLIRESGPLAYYSWSGLEQHTNTTQTIRAVNILYALIGNLDEAGGNVLFPAVATNDVSGTELLERDRQSRTLGMAERPLGPARFGFVSAAELYTAALESRPYKARGLVAFGANLLMSNADAVRGREALSALDFHVHVDLFMNPTAQQADIVLPAASAFETEGLRIGFETSEEAQSLVQLRQPVVAPRAQSRPDRDIIFDLAVRMGFGEQFWQGDAEAAIRHQLAPSGITPEALRANPGGVRIQLNTVHRKFAETAGGKRRGFNTPSGKIELYSETLLNGGQDPLPRFAAPKVTPENQPQPGRFPFVLTCSKGTMFCESQHRALPSLRKRSMEPEVEIHPQTAEAAGIGEGQWVIIRTPDGAAKARAKLNDSLDPQVICGNHGWWQECTELDLPGYDPFCETSVNYNQLISLSRVDPISGSTPLRSYACAIEPYSA